MACPPTPAPPHTQVEDLTHVPHVSRELMLVKVSCSAQQRGELVSLSSVGGCPAGREAGRVALEFVAGWRGGQPYEPRQ